MRTKAVDITVREAILLALARCHSYDGIYRPSRDWRAVVAGA
jgi:hypothetical protein